MTHCAIVPFITVAHIHIKRILTFSLILECVLSVFVYPHVPSSSPSALTMCPAHPALQECVTSTPLSSVGLKWHQLLSPFSSREWCSLFSTSPHSCRETKAEPQHCLFSFYGSLFCLLEIVFVLLFFFLLREWELTRHKPKIYYLTTP